MDRADNAPAPASAPNIRRRIMRSLFGSYATKALVELVSLATKVVIARLLVARSPEAFGIFAQALLVYGILSALQTLGMPRHLMRQPAPMYGSYLRSSLFFSIILSLLLFAGADYAAALSPQLPFALRILAPLLPLSVIIDVPSVYLARELRMDRLIWVEGAANLAFLVVAALLAATGNLYCLIWGNVAATVVRVAVVWWIAGPKVPLTWSRQEVAPLIKGSAWFFGLTVMDILYHRADIGIAGYFLSDTQAGYWNMTIVLTMLVINVIEPAFFQVLYPLFCRYHEQPERLVRVYQTSTLLVMAIEVPAYAFLMVNFQTIVVTILGASWAEAGRLAQWLCILPIIDPFSMFGRGIIMAKGQERVLVYFLVTAVFILAIAGIVLTPRLGLTGMVVARYCMLGANLFMIIPLVRIIGLRQAFFPGLLLLYISFPIIVATGHFIDSPLSRFSVTLALAAVPIAITGWRLAPELSGYLKELRPGWLDSRA